MTPTPQEHGEAKIQIPRPVLNGDEIVISGMAGIFPSSHHIKDLSEILYNKVNPIISDQLRWKCDHPEAAKHCGIVPNINRFDAQFFKVNHKQTNNMDPLSRKILEQAYQAIYDAGVNSEQLSGKKIGVFIGSCFSEADKAIYFLGTAKSGLGITGCCRSMYANRISYWLNAKGPSITIDQSCSSSSAALEQAYLSIKRGECEAAVVGGAYLCLHPQSSVHYGRIMQQCMDGKTKSFNENGDGSVKSEAINVLFLQRAKDALRVYAEVIHVKTEYIGLVLKEDDTPKYGFLRDHDATVKFLDNFYKEAGVPPHVIEYVEAYGAAIPEVDRVELNTIDEVICKGKDNPLLIGSVMSNVGYSEASSGITAVTKVLLGYHTGELAANLHYSQPLQGVPALAEGRMRVLTDHQRFNRTYTAVNGMSISGINAHVLLHGHFKPKDPSRYTSSIPHLVTLSARQDTTITKFIEDLKSRPIDPEEIALIHNIHQYRTPGHLGRGFVILDKNGEGKTISISQKAEYYNEVRRPLWFVYSGMGSQWSGMGAQLMKIPIFAAAIERCRIALEPKGIDIVHIITSTDPTIFDNILHSFVGIAAVQIGLTDILKALGLEPEGIIGHSVGELGCAYADGCLTAEEMILSAYSRGLVSLQTSFIRGSMAAVGLGYEKVVKICPSEIEVACHNGPDSSTISGPADIMKDFVAELTAKKIFAKEVPCSNIAYHSRYIAGAGPGLLKYLSEVIKTPRARSKRWVSTSVPKNNWDSAIAKYSSAEYHTNNLLSPVLFEESLPYIPSNAVLVEVAPHGLLQAILKRSLPETCTNLALTRRSHPDNTHLVLEAIGKLYIEGYTSKIQVLYPKVEMPVSTSTPLLSHHVEWAHGEHWFYPLYQAPTCCKATACKRYITIHDKENMYLKGHIINGKLVYPYAAALVNVWEVLAMTHKEPMKQLSVEFKDVHLFSQPILHEQGVLNIHVSLQRGTGYFEVMNGNVKVASGTILRVPVPSKFINQDNHVDAEDTKLYATDVYTLFESRGYTYSGDFQSIENVSASLNSAELIWRDNWVTFIDGILQLHTLRQPYMDVSLATYINKIGIDVEEHYLLLKTLKTEDKVLVKAHLSETCDFTRCGGVTIQRIAHRNNISRLVDSRLALHSLKFVPNFKNTDDLDVSTSLKVYLQIIAENLGKDTIKIVAFTNDYNKNNSVFNAMKHIGSETCGVEIQYEQVNAEINFRERDYLLKDVDVVIVKNLSSDDNICQLLHNLLRPNTFIVSEEQELERRIRPSTLYRVVSSHGNRNKIDLVRWKPTNYPAATTAITMDRSTKLSLIASTRNNLAPRHRLLIVSPYPAPAGLKQLVSCWRKEGNRNMVNLVMVNNGETRHYLLDDLPDIDLAFNVVDHGIWGGEYLVPLEDIKEKINNSMLQSSEIGNLGALNWVEAPEITDGIPVNVHYTGINSRDLEKATGILPIQDTDDISYGSEFSGVLDSGERVMGIVRSGAISRRVRAIPELLWPVPEHWSLEDAATVPVAYALVFYCLVIRTTIVRNMRVFVHEGPDAIGQAFISVALALGCEVFTTVGDSRKRRFLRKLFPELKETHIGFSGDVNFSDFVLSETKNKGCDVVIGNSKNSSKSSLFKICASFGITLKLARISSQETYGMNYLSNAKSYAMVDIHTFLAENKNAEDMKKLQTFISEGISRGYVRPLSRVVLAAEEAPRAFRLFAANQHHGRVLLRLIDSLNTAEPRYTTDKKGSHLVLLDEEIFGVQLVDRLVERGARKLLIHNFNSNVTNVLQYKLHFWNKMGVEAILSSGNISTQQDVVELLHKTAKTGLVHGVYTVTSGEDNHNQNALINYLDLSVRKLCPKLRYFAVINVGESKVGEQTCLTRTRQHLPAVVLNIPHQDNCKAYRSAVNATELALRKGRGVLLAKPVPVQQPSLLQQISSISGIDITEDLFRNKTVEELGIKPHQLPIIASLLRTQHNILLNEEDVSALTIETLIELENSSTVLKKVIGLQAFFSNIDSDELEATSPLVVKPTLSNSAILRDDQFDASRTYLCIIPGMEGHHARFHNLCQRLKIPAIVLHPGLDRPNESVHDTAERYVKILNHRTGLKNNFYLLGYETGILVALEMTKILESHNLTGTVYCLGCAPDEMKPMIEEYISDFKTEGELDDAVINHMFKLVVGSSDVRLEEALKEATTWNEKLDACMSLLRGRVSYSTQYTRAYIEYARASIRRSRQYVSEPCGLRSRLILLRAATPLAAPASLQLYSQQPVALHQLDVPLGLLASDNRCAAIINQYLDSNILGDFEKMNLCEDYLIDPNIFMSPEKSA